MIIRGLSAGCGVFLLRLPALLGFFTLQRLRLAYGTVWFPQVQEAYMSSLGTAYAFFRRQAADLALFHACIITFWDLFFKESGQGQGPVKVRF